MSFTSNDNLVLVAPRPVRLASGAAPFPFHSPVAHRPRSRAAILSAATDAFDRLMLAEDSGDQHEHRAPELSEKDRLSPRTSPRSMPSEALEEFLSILQHPSALRFQPTSPVMRPTTASHFFTYRRQTPCSLSPSLPSDGLGLTIAGHADDKASEAGPYTFRVLGGALGSPISRMQTRNPFPRHQAYENGVVGLLRPPSVLSPSPSSMLPPAAIPLPSPTPDEMESEIVS
ncbi:uncharacterized protein TRAVEDRAFT_28050 [Trametes versicolor FP-101664 SS1]|uniref:uncharacterized protein n=1 Tax=Trametes versicolor (strain FP-101664) TaxID=717944 RepID=UPI0004621393|nr:uncharacterized protein TRAVEDRAFT_28050 [Trametes versicolor FP-101664 SS1]EIW60494.1 hypothetical protein TRAVEDRAFT_28050 [Trametes versicolor FP-101664 SS1]